MKFKRSLIGMCLVGGILLSAVPTLGATKSRVPEKTEYFGLIDVYDQSCIDANYACHNSMCPGTPVEWIDYTRIPGKPVWGDKPSYEKNVSEMEVKFFIQNHMPFTLPVGTIALNQIIDKDIFPDIVLDIKAGVNTYNVVIDGETVTTPPIKGINMNNNVGEYSDLKESHWAYSSIVTALKNGWITPKNSTTVGMEAYSTTVSPVNGLAYTNRSDSITHQEMFVGINRVLMTNGIYLGDRFSRTDMNGLLHAKYSIASLDEYKELIELKGKYGDYADWLNVCMGTMSALRGPGITINTYELLRDIETREVDDIDRYLVANTLHAIVQDMGLPVVNDLSGPEFKEYDNLVIKDNRLHNVSDMNGVWTYIVTRGLIAPEVYNGVASGFTAENVGKPEFAVILCNLDRAIKAAKTAK